MASDGVFAAFNRLTEIQKSNINKNFFRIAYNCVAESKGDSSKLNELILTQTKDCPHLTSDLIRYCRLVELVK